MAIRKMPDWEAIEKLYRAGQISNAEIGRRHGITETAVRKHAKKFQWTKDLSEQVRIRTREKLVREDRDPHARDEEIVEESASAGVRVILSHRKDIAKLRALEQKLLEELGGGEDGSPPTRLYLAQYQGSLIEKAVGLTIAERAGAARDLSTVQKQRITLERQAWNLDDEGDDPNAPDSVKLTFYRKKPESDGD